MDLLVTVLIATNVVFVFLVAILLIYVVKDKNKYKKLYEEILNNKLQIKEDKLIDLRYRTLIITISKVMKKTAHTDQEISKFKKTISSFFLNLEILASTENGFAKDKYFYAWLIEYIEKEMDSFVANKKEKIDSDNFFNKIIDQNEKYSMNEVRKG